VIKTGVRSDPVAGQRIVKCVLAWAAVLFIPVTLAVGVAWPWAERMGVLDSEIDTARDQIARYQRLVATLPALRAELEQVNNNPDLQAFYFHAATPTLAGATLQQNVQDMVKATGGRLVSTQMLPAAPNEKPPTVRVRIQLQGSTDQLFDLLYQIEDARPFLFVDQVSIRSMVQPERPAATEGIGRARRARPRPATEDLTVRLDIFGFALGGT
jgi:general secretion pathway protein M